MNKICGYSCEHNKGGVCQITMCNKQPYLTTTTDEPLKKQIETFARWQDPTIGKLTSLLEKIKEIVNNEKITGIEAKLLIKDLLEEKGE